MTCLHTGCDVLIKSTGAVYHGDLFIMGVDTRDTVGTMILHHTGHTYPYDLEIDWVFSDSFTEILYLDSAKIIAITSGAVSPYSERAQSRLAGHF